MSAFLTAGFGDLAPYLADYGYKPVPIKPGFKAPMLDGWQAGHPPGHYLPRCRSWGTGILTVNCPAVDLDIRDREVARVLIELAGEALGPTPFRIGAPPKALLPFSTVVPFDKISGRWWAMPGDDWRTPSYSPHRIEVLGQGQQFVAYARHPRGTWYRWRRGEPMDTQLIDLPEIDQANAKRFLVAAETVLRQVGAVPLRRQNKVWFPDSEQPETTSRHRVVSGGRRDSSWQLLDPQTLARRIDPKYARRLNSGGWICSCPAHTSEGHRSLSITPRRGGGSIVHCFAECSFQEIAQEISAIVGRAAA